MNRNEIQSQNSRGRDRCGVLVRCVWAIGLIMLLSALSENRATADDSTYKNEVLEQSVAKGSTTNPISGQEEVVMLVERMKTKEFLCDTNGICSKIRITIKDLKAVLGVSDLKEMRRAPSSGADNPAYIFRVKGAHCIIQPSDPTADISDDNTVVKVDVNTNTRNVKDRALLVPRHKHVQEGDEKTKK